MGYVVFSQTPEGRIDAARIIANARSYFFHLSADILAAPDPATLRIELSSASEGWTARFTITSRPATRDDVANAGMAEARGQATGMSLLAERCGAVWEVAPEGDVPDHALLDACALLASVALGPVMPPEIDTLFGVRGARERADKLRKQRGTYR